MTTHRHTLQWVLVVVLLLCASWRSAWAQVPTRLRLAGIAPEGTAWARELKAFANQVERETGGAVQIKWYLGGIAGNDAEMQERIRKNQLDGAASAGPLCQRVAPSLAILRIPGLVQTKDEALFVMNALLPTFAAEARSAGFAFLGAAVLGTDMIFLRQPVRSLSELRKLRLWWWNLDSIEYPRALGLQLVPRPVEEARAAYEAGQTDGFIALPGAALGFQFYTQVHSALNLGLPQRPGCFLLTTRALDTLPVEHQRAIRGAAAKMGVRFTEVSRIQDEALLGGLFARQGVRQLPVDDSFQRELVDAVQQVRARLETTLSPALVRQVNSLLTERRATHVSQ